MRSLILVLTWLFVVGVAAAQTPGGRPNFESINGRPQFPGYGVKCDWNGTTGTDDTAAMNAALATFTVGTVANIAPGKNCLIDSANLTIPANVVLHGMAGPGQQNGSTLAILTAGSGIVLNPLYTVMMGAGSELRSMTIRRKGLTASPTFSQVITQVGTWAAENSVGVTLPSSTPGITIDNTMVIGFNTCYKSNTGRFTIKDSAGDCVNGVEISGAGDVNVINNVRFEPYYRSGSALTNGDGARPGVAFHLHDGNGGTTISNSFAFLFATGFIANEGTSIFMHNNTFEWHDVDGNGVTQTACARLLSGSVGIWITNLSCNGFDYGVWNESHGAPVWINNPLHTPGTGTTLSYYLGAAPAASPPTLVLSGSFVAGQTITAVFTDATNIPGSPLSIPYIIRSGDTATTAAQGLAAVINGAWQLTRNHIQAGATGGTVTVSRSTGYTTLSSLTCSTSGTAVCTTGGAGTAGAGSVTQLINPYMGTNGVISVAADSSNAINQAMIVNPYADTAPPGGGQIQIGAASVTRTQIDNNNPSGISGSDLSSCGTSPSVGSGSNNATGIVNEGAGATGCTLTFTTPYPASPFCSVQLIGGSGTLATLTASTTTLVITNGSQSIFSYACSPNGPNMSGTYTIPNPPPPSPSIQTGALTGTCCSGATTETVIGTIKIPGNSMGTKGAASLDCLYTFPNSANTKTFRWRLTTNPSGSTSGNQINADSTATTSAEQQIRLMVRNTSATTQVSFGSAPTTPYGSNTTASNTFAIDTTGDSYISINAITASGAETITLQHCYAVIANVP